MYTVLNGETKAESDNLFTSYLLQAIERWESPCFLLFLIFHHPNNNKNHTRMLQVMQQV
jgi:hypothetical protein